MSDRASYHLAGMSDSDSDSEDEFGSFSRLLSIPNYGFFLLSYPTSAIIFTHNSSPTLSTERYFKECNYLGRNVSTEQVLYFTQCLAALWYWRHSLPLDLRSRGKLWRQWRGCWSHLDALPPVGLLNRCTGQYWTSSCRPTSLGRALTVT